jgi:uncharacterized membrane protein
MNWPRWAPQHEPRRRRRLFGEASWSAIERVSPDSEAEPLPASEPVDSEPFLAVYRLTAAAVLGVVGLTVSLYLTATRFDPGEVTLYCSISTGGCQQVAASSYSMIGQVPVSVFGMAWFVAMLVLLGLSLYRYTDLLRLARLVWTACGVVVVGYLIYAEVFLIGALCEWCTSVHVVTIALFGLTLWETLDLRARNHCIPTPDLLA